MAILRVAILLSLLVVGSVWSHGVKNALDCGLCQLLIDGANKVVSNHKADHDVIKLVISACEANHGGLGSKCRGKRQCTELCTGIVNEFAPILFENAATSVLDPVRVCTDNHFCPMSEKIDDSFAASLEDAIHGPRQHVSSRTRLTSDDRKPLQVLHVSLYKSHRDILTP